MLGARHRTATRTRPYTGCWSSRSHSRSEQVPLRCRSRGRAGGPTAAVSGCRWVPDGPAGRQDRGQRGQGAGSRVVNGSARSRLGLARWRVGVGGQDGARHRAVVEPATGRVDRRCGLSRGRGLPRGDADRWGFRPEWSPPTRPDACLARPPDSRHGRTLLRQRHGRTLLRQRQKRMATRRHG
jgi:hypothetical protein